ncbi:hypothetical protein PIB30_054852 [Stylosanthes scabra]|uniref:Uncharacterized protein n=1 Tax=Stylosanthes scabra TaxID=79078 RepID=A0ABU6TIP0_9FABA|nr:hypothetical protein [Stylosanthes scabra]
MAAFKFLISLPGGLPKTNKFTCRWILDGSDAEVGKFLGWVPGRFFRPVALQPLPPLPQLLLPASTPSETQRTKRQSSKRDRAKVVNLEGEEEVQEDPAADLQQKRRKKKARVDEAFEKALGDDSAWEHEVDPLKVAFPEGFNFRKALNAGLTYVPVREALTKMPPESLLGESYHLKQVGVETSLTAKMKTEKELSAALDQIEILKGKRDSALSYLPFKEKADTLKDELSENSLEHQSALDRIAQLEEDNGALETQFESSQLSLEGERKRSVAVEKQVGSLAASLKTCQADLSKATEASKYWRSEWQKLGTESRWDPKGRRIFVPQESDVEVELPPAEEIVSEQHPEPII